MILTSDHGDHDSSHKLEHKTVLYEEAARVPWIMRLPGRIAAAQRNDHCMVATGLDLMATLCDYAELPTPPHCPGGRSVRPAAEAGAEAGADASAVRRHVYAESAASVMVVEREWKLVQYDHGAHAEQLYDLVHDPGECHNHALDPCNATVLERLRRKLREEQAFHRALAL